MTSGQQVPDGYGSPASVIKAADASLGSRKCGAGSQSETCVGIEIQTYSAPKIYEKLVHCDVGLSPSEVYPVHDVATLSAKTAGLFQKDDTQPEDMVKRCKRTANAGLIARADESMVRPRPRRRGPRRDEAGTDS